TAVRRGDRLRRPGVADRTTPRRPMRIAVTGGTGYVGTHTVRALLAAGHRVRLLATDSPTDTALARGLAEYGQLDTLRGDGGNDCGGGATPAAPRRGWAPPGTPGWTRGCR